MAWCEVESVVIIFKKKIFILNAVGLQFMNNFILWNKGMLMCL